MKRKVALIVASMILSFVVIIPTSSPILDPIFTTFIQHGGH